MPTFCRAAVFVGGREEQIAGEKYKMTTNVIAMSEILDRHPNQITGKEMRILAVHTPQHNVHFWRILLKNSKLDIFLIVRLIFFDTTRSYVALKLYLGVFLELSWQSFRRRTTSK